VLTQEAPEIAAPGGLGRRALRLASASPRRSLLLREHGFDHTASPAPIDDSDLFPGCGSLRDWTAGLAYLKARSAWETLSAEERRSSVVLGADTIVIKSGRPMGKPADARDAERMLRTLSAGEHEVVSGVCVLAPGAPRRIFTDSARVHVGPLSDEVIHAYVASNLWRGKAGGYNLSERLADGWPIEFEGDPGTIMGLPMRRLAPVLRGALGNIA
jgi:septum formation protein